MTPGNQPSPASSPTCPCRVGPWPIPPPAGTLEEVVATAVKHLAKKHKSEVDKAEETIEKYGLTIEVSRLRDRLARAATSDVERLVLSTPGVPEALFNKAVEKELEEEEKRESRSSRTSGKGGTGQVFERGPRGPQAARVQSRSQRGQGAAREATPHPGSGRTGRAPGW